MEAEVFPWVACLGGEELAGHQTRHAGSIFCRFGGQDLTFQEEMQKNPS